MPNTSYDLTRTKYYDPEINLTTQVEMRYGPYEFLGLPVVITRNHTICPSNFSEDVRWKIQKLKIVVKLCVTILKL